LAWWTTEATMRICLSRPGLSSCPSWDFFAMEGRIRGFGVAVESGATAGKQISAQRMAT
jgi:hypothetical protein